MAGRGEDDIGADEHVVADHDTGTVQNDEVVIGVDVLADSDVVAVVAEEGRLQVHVRRIPEEFLQPEPVKFDSVSVVLVTQRLGPLPFAN